MRTTVSLEQVDVDMMFTLIVVTFLALIPACEIIIVWTGWLKMPDMKLQDMKLTDQVTGHEIAGHEIPGHENAGH